MSQGSVAAH